MRNYFRPAAVIILAGLYLLTAGAPFFAPYSPKEQFRDYFYAPPSSFSWRDSGGGWTLGPSLRLVERVDLSPQYRSAGKTSKIKFFVKGSQYRLLGFSWDIHLFGVEGQTQPVFLLGSDGLGRDLFTRILHGARVSLTIGLAAIALTLTLGVAAGLAAGYFAGWTDTILMRAAELLLALPSLFLILGIRAVLPQDLSLWELFWLMVLIFTLFGWATVARVVRGQVLSIRTREHVLAARVVGATDWRILTRHVLPFVAGYLYVQSTFLIPSFMLGEITLSFLGVGVQEPDASWGNLLAAASSVRTLTSFPWLLSPAAFVFAAVLGFNLLGDRSLEAETRRQIW